MFPYPSPDGFSVNQLRGIVITDVVARFQEARGRKVFRPFGWDSFGIGIEQQAERDQVSPAEIVRRGTEKMKQQLEQFGARIDWDSQLATSDPKFFRWTQWLFTQLHERDLAYRDIVSLKWCRECRTLRANEEIPDGRCVICRTEVEEVRAPQWFVRITDYAERLHHGLRSLKWPQRVKSMQRHWIGRREGYRLTLKATSEFRYEHAEFDVFLRHLEYLPAATYVVLAPEHALVEELCDDLYREDVLRYRNHVVRLNERERLSATGQPEGYPTGAFALNPLTLKYMPVWVSKMALPHVRYGAILGTPGHNEIHAAFARRFRLPTKVVIADRHPAGEASADPARDAMMINCGPLSGMVPLEAARRIRSILERRSILESTTVYHLRDWLFARQRFWGEPIPMVHCAQCGVVPVPLEGLPVELPPVERLPDVAAASAPETTAERPESPITAFEAGGDTWDISLSESGESATAVREMPRVHSPLMLFPGFVETTCPTCGSPAQRETDIMPQWAGSCWYYLRYLDPGNDERIFDPERADPWVPVDLCVGGIEHAILHLLYVRFFSYFLHDLGLTRREEPFRRLFNQGRFFRREPTLTERKTPTHRGHRILAEPYLEQYGADALRLHLMFIGPPTEDIVWSEGGLRGAQRFLERARLFVQVRKAKGRFVSRNVLVEKHRLIRRVSEAVRSFKLNKAVSAFMEFVKVLTTPPLTPEEVDQATLRTFTVLLAPFAPHLAAELWQTLGADGEVFAQPWPEYSEELLRPLEVELVVQINNRTRDRLRIEEEPSKQELIQAALALPKIQALTEGRPPERVVIVPGRLINLVYPTDGADGTSA